MINATRGQKFTVRFSDGVCLNTRVIQAGEKYLTTSFGTFEKRGEDLCWVADATAKLEAQPANEAAAKEWEIKP